MILIQSLKCLYDKRHAEIYARLKICFIFLALCGLVVRVPGYRSGGPGFDSRALQEKKVVGLEWDPLSLVSTTEELLGRNSSGSGLESR
jgi:hypothetical protein